jgi:hypothetical protein
MSAREGPSTLSRRLSKRSRSQLSTPTANFDEWLKRQREKNQAIRQQIRDATKKFESSGMQRFENNITKLSSQRLNANLRKQLIRLKSANNNTKAVITQVFSNALKHGNKRQRFPIRSLAENPYGNEALWKKIDGNNRSASSNTITSTLYHSSKEDMNNWQINDIVKTEGATWHHTFPLWTYFADKERSRVQTVIPTKILKKAITRQTPQSNLKNLLPLVLTDKILRAPVVGADINITHVNIENDLRRYLAEKVNGGKSSSKTFFIPRATTRHEVGQVVNKWLGSTHNNKRLPSGWTSRYGHVNTNHFNLRPNVPLITNYHANSLAQLSTGGIPNGRTYATVVMPPFVSKVVSVRKVPGEEKLKVYKLQFLRFG